MTASKTAIESLADRSRLTLDRLIRDDRVRRLLGNPLRAGSMRLFDHRRPLGVIALFTIVPLVATMTSLPGHLVADARYEHFANPAQFLARHASAWDGQRTIGQPTQYFSPALGTYQAVLQLLGLAPWIIQRLTHVLLLALAGLGGRRLASTLGLGSGAAVVSGLAYAFNPYVAQYLLPSGLFAAFALAPWFGHIVARGIGHNSDRWKWAAIFSVCVFSLGALNTSAVALGLVPTVAVLGLRLVERQASMRSLFAFGWRAISLSVLVSGAAFVALAGNADVIRFNLLATETPATVAQNSSASESWRGLGFWLTYLQPIGDNFLNDHLRAYVTNPLIIIMTFAAVVAAGVALFTRRDRLSATMAALAALSVLAMTGIHPVDDPSPFGAFLSESFESSNFFRGFRSTFKAGVGLQLAIAVLIGLLWQRARAHSTYMAIPIALLLAANAFPFWTGGLYPVDRSFDEVPEYWRDTFEWFESQPSDQAVLVLPSAARTTYDWGYVNDTLFDAHLKQPVFAARTLPQSTAFLSQLIEVVDEHVGDGPGLPDDLAPILNQAGVRWVLIQNDVDERASGIGDLSALDRIRDSDNFELAATFGPNDPRIEIYELREWYGEGAVVFPSTVEVHGGPDVWPALASSGWLDNVALVPEGLSTAPNAVVVTDGGQRRVARVSNGVSWSSPVLAASEDLDRPLTSLSPRAPTVADFGDLSTVTASYSGGPGTVWDRARWPDKAVDADPNTAWATNIGGRQELRLELKEPIGLSQIEIDLFAGGASPEEEIQEVDIVLESTSGTELYFRVEVTNEPSIFGFGVVTSDVSAIRIGVTPLDGAGFVGLSEVGVIDQEGVRLDGRRRLRVSSPETSGEAPVYHMFARLDRGGEEAVIRRDFSAAGGTVMVQAGLVADLPTAGVFDHRYGLNGASEGLDALVDNQLFTTWQTDSINPDSLYVRFDNALINELRLTFVIGDAGGALRSRPRKISLTLVDETGRIVHETQQSVGRSPTCNSASPRLGEDGCFETWTIPITSRAYAAVVRFERIDSIDGSGRAQPVKVSEIDINLDFDLDLDRRTAGIEQVVRPELSACVDLFELDGEPISMRIDPATLTDTTSLAEGVDAISCHLVEIENGSHSLEGLDAGRNYVETVLLYDPSQPPSVETRTPHRAPVTKESQTRQRISAVLEVGETLVTRIPDHQGWVVESRGPDGQRTSSGGFIAWHAAEAGVIDLEFTYQPQTLYLTGWILAIIGLVAAAVLILHPHLARSTTARSGPGGAPVESKSNLGEARGLTYPRRLLGALFKVPKQIGNRSLFPAGGRRWVVVSVAMALVLGLAYITAETIGVVVALWVVGLWLSGQRSVALILVPVLPVLLAVLTIIEAPVPGEASRAVRFATDRPITHLMGSLTIVVWFGAAVMIWLFSDPGDSSPEDDEPAEETNAAGKEEEEIEAEQEEAPEKEAAHDEEGS